MSFSDFIGLCLLGVLVLLGWFILESRKDWKRVVAKLEESMEQDEPTPQKVAPPAPSVPVEASPEPQGVDPFPGSVRESIPVSDRPLFMFRNIIRPAELGFTVTVYAVPPWWKNGCKHETVISGYPVPTYEEAEQVAQSVCERWQRGEL